MADSAEPVAEGPVTVRIPPDRVRVYQDHDAERGAACRAVRQEEDAVMLLRLVTLLLALACPASAATRLNVAIGADVNVVEVHKTVLGPGIQGARRPTSS